MMVSQEPKTGSAWPMVCMSCRRPAPSQGFHFRCPQCGSPFEFSDPLLYQPDPTHKTSMLRYRSSFPLAKDATLVSLGEGDTPLVPVSLRDRTVYMKVEGANPTGSFKDRGTAVLVSALLEAGVKIAVEDSSGNAGASFAAYAARAGITARVFVPDYASGPKRRQIEAYGAQVVRVKGPRSHAAQAALEAVEQGAVYASHAYLPYGHAGMATAAFELVEQLGQTPGSVVVPVGQGSFLLGLHLGFHALKRAGTIARLPHLIAVQARACAPLWAVHQMGASGLQWMREGETLAEGVRILRPLRGDAVLKAVEESQGQIVAVEEKQITTGRDELARRGLYVEPTSAIVWQGALAVWEQLVDPVVMILTGSGLKAG